MEVFQLFVTASIPVLKVLFITALGLYLALERVNILGEETRKNLNTVIFYGCNGLYMWLYHMITSNKLVVFVNRLCFMYSVLPWLVPNLPRQ
jgi:branched-subunit amino acid permease